MINKKSIALRDNNGIPINPKKPFLYLVYFPPVIPASSKNHEIPEFKEELTNIHEGVYHVGKRKYFDMQVGDNHYRVELFDSMKQLILNYNYYVGRRIQSVYWKDSLYYYREPNESDKIK